MPLDGKGTLTATLKNLDEYSHNVKVGISLPKELKLTGGTSASKSVTVPAKQQMSLSFDVENLAVVGESSYNVLLIADYEDLTTHYSSSVNSIVAVSENSTPATGAGSNQGILSILGLGNGFPSYVILILIAVVLALAYIYFQVKR